MVDTRDLKSLGQKCPCGFDSRPRHKRDGFRRPSCAIAPLPNPCLKTELQPETMQEGHGRHSLCNSISGLFHRTPLGKTLLQENEEDGEHKADERRDVVPVESLAFEEEGNNQSEDDEGDNLLDNF